MIVGWSSAPSHLDRADDRLVVIVVIAINKNPRDSLLPALLRVRHLHPRGFPLLVGLDRVAESADRMRQFVFLRRLRDRNRGRISAGIRDNAIVNGGQQSRGRVADILKGCFVAPRRARKRRELIAGRERGWWRSIHLLHPRLWNITDHLARSRIIVKAHLATGRNFDGVKPVVSRRIPTR